MKVLDDVGDKLRIAEVDPGGPTRSVKPSAVLVSAHFMGIIPYSELQWLHGL